MLLYIFFVAILAFLFYFFFFSPRSQAWGKVIYAVDTKEKIVALSFDDGPNEPYTSQILGILAAHNTKATFFVVGENARRHPETVKKILQQGHALGNHSYSHSFLAPLLSPSFEKEISKTQELLFTLTGKKPTLFRPPWFFRQPAMLKTAAKLGLTTVTGTFGSNWEVFQISAQEIADTAQSRAAPGSILVFHDGYNSKGGNREKTVEAIKILIPKLQNAGYKFVTIPELFRYLKHNNLA